MIYLICPFERKGMQCKVRRAAQGRPPEQALQRRNAPFSLEPSGHAAIRLRAY
ncbi:MAG TPA: hypothetical protein VIE65_05885 [Methylobacter sp.]